jgi:hypothetical protein
VVRLHQAMAKPASTTAAPELTSTTAAPELTTTTAAPVSISSISSISAIGKRLILIGKLQNLIQSEDGHFGPKKICASGECSNKDNLFSTRTRSALLLHENVVSHDCRKHKVSRNFIKLLCCKTEVSETF